MKKSLGALQVKMKKRWERRLRNEPAETTPPRKLDVFEMARLSLRRFGKYAQSTAPPPG
jgi:hypothetical protein